MVSYYMQERKKYNEYSLSFLASNKEHTTETGRLFFRRRSKQLPLARKETVLGHLAKRTRAPSFALCSSVFPSRFFAVVDLWLPLLVQYDTDNPRNQALKANKC